MSDPSSTSWSDLPFTTFSGQRARMVIADRLSRQHHPVLGDVKHELSKNLCSGPISIGIVGAGMAGIYTAFILDRLAIPGLSYEILEGSDRAGGRVYTHRFSEQRHDYYEVGAMRFPKIDSMKRFFDFCNVTTTPLITYYYEKDSVACPMLFNNIRATKPVDWGVNPFHVQPEVQAYTRQDPGEIFKGTMATFINALKANWSEGFEALLKWDNYSTGQYLMERCGMSRREVEYLETFTGSSNLFYRAFTEEVLEMVDFTSDEWRCIEDGTQTLVDNAIAKLKTKPLLGKKVTKIYPVLNTPSLHRPEGVGSSSPEPELPSIVVAEPQGAARCSAENLPPPPPLRPQAEPLLVEVVGESEPRQYDAVVLTTSLGCAQHIDLTQAKLNWGQRLAIRRLGYAAATKVGIKFSCAWWRVAGCGVTQGGFAVTDEPLRICVYPSYNLTDDPAKPAVLLCSYTWTQDADRLASLIHRSSPAGEDELRDLLLRGLARLHSKTFEEIRPLYITHHAWAWYQDPWTTGAYASFEPAQWAELYPLLCEPAARGRLIFAGEAASTHHAWILGALESGYRAVAHTLIVFGLFEEVKKLKRLFGTTDETVLDGPGFAFHQVYHGAFRADGEDEEEPLASV